MKTTSLLVLAGVLTIAVGILLQISHVGAMHRIKVIANYDDCVAAGNPVMESYPSQCRTQDGRTFVDPRERVAEPQPVTNDSGPFVGAGCAVAGCSKEICAEASEADGVVSSCVYLAQFACYKNARCERQSDGKCGWRQTAELQACINASPATRVAPMSD